MFNNYVVRCATVEILRENVEHFEIMVKPFNDPHAASTSEQVELEVVQIDETVYQVYFKPMHIERYIVHIYFNHVCVNLGKLVCVNFKVTISSLQFFTQNVNFCLKK